MEKDFRIEGNRGGFLRMEKEELRDEKRKVIFYGFWWFWKKDMKKRG